MATKFKQYGDCNKRFSKCDIKKNLNLENLHFLIYFGPQKLTMQLEKKHRMSCLNRQTASVSPCSPHPPLRVCFHCDVEETHVRVSCRTSQTIRVSPVTSQTCDLLCLVPPCPRLYYISYTTLPTLHHHTSVTYPTPLYPPCIIIPPMPFQLYVVSPKKRHTKSTCHAYHYTELCNSCFMLLHSYASLIFQPALQHTSLSYRPF